MNTKLENQDLSEIIKEIKGLIELLINKFGTWGFIGIFGIIIVLVMAWKWYNIYRKDQEEKSALNEKERSIQRLAQENREYKIIILKEKFKWSDEQIEKYILENRGFDDGPSARKSLEHETQRIS